MQLIVGTDSTWSLRVWLCSKIAQLDLELNVIDLSAPGFKSSILEHSPTGLVPALKTDTIVIHDSLAITEFINEHTSGALYPQSTNDRALARSLCAEMHSGFVALRTHCPFTLDSVSPLKDIDGAIAQELTRIEQLFAQASGTFMFEKASAVDAFYAILAYRLETYGVTLLGKAGEYQQSLLNWPLLLDAIKMAHQWNTETKR